ncbi:MAG TPA: PfkB family carbohydrate kinase [Abditibacteriaceae bacterium]|jgi:ribokinase
MILGIGAVAVDDLLFVERFPIAGEKLRVASRRRDDGGLAGTALAAAAKLGSEAAWLGVLGDDELSHAARVGLERDGVSTGHCHFDADARPHYSVILIEKASGQRTILACNEGVTAFPVARIEEISLENVRAVFVDHTQVAAAIALATRARTTRIPVVSDIERAPDGIEVLLPLCDHFIGALGFAQTLTGETEPENVVGALRKTGAGETCCAVTDGERGCWFLQDDTLRHLPAFAVEAVDTTGCGDVFHGAYLGEIARGQGVEAALRFASAAAALCATRVGGRNGIPTRAEIGTLRR